MSCQALTDAFGSWRQISLEDVERRAPLLDRQETKYVLPAGTLDPMLATMDEDFDVLSIEGRTTFTYETVYFDTTDLTAYHHHAQGRRRRVKVRSRCYVDSGLCFFEVKTKGRRNSTVKERIPYDRSRHGSMDAEAHAFLQECVDRAYGGALRLPSEPSLLMRFQRTTLVGRGAPERVTIDQDLQFFGTDGAVVAAPRSTVIVEVKSPNGRGRADAVLRGAGARGARCSKYCIGLNLVRRDLRYNAFKQALTAHFGWSTPRPPVPAVGATP